MTTRVLLQQIFNYLKNEYDVSDWWRNESALEICVGAILVQNTTWRQAHVALKQLITTGNLPAPKRIRIITKTNNICQKLGAIFYLTYYFIYI